MVWPRLMVMTVVMVVVMVTPGRGGDIPDRQRLRADLLRNYDKETIPSNRTQPLTVTMNGFTIRNVEMHEQTHRLHIHAWAHFGWVDKRLLWDPADYDDIHKLSFNPRDLWLPDLTAYNAAAAEDIPLTSRNRLVLTPDGEVIQVAAYDLSFSCVADLTYWPHDTHQCRLKIGSWVHDGYTIDLRVADAITTELQMEQVTENPDGTMNTMNWNITGSGVLREELFYACCSEPYINLEVVLRLSRAAPAYNWLIKVPAVCLFLLTLVVFVLPPGAGEKVTFGGLCLLLNLVFLVFAHDTIRNAPSHTPLLVQLVVTQLVVTATSVLIAAWVVRTAQGPYFSPPPSGLYNFSLGIAPALGLSAYVKQGRTGAGTPKKEEVEMVKEGEGSVQREQDGIVAQWLLFGAVLDRFALCLYLTVSLIMLIRFFGMI